MSGIPSNDSLLPRIGLLLLVALAFALAHAGQASAATCNISGKERKLGATYVTSISATKVSCAGAVKVVKAFNKCRRAKGVAGRCSKKVNGYTCSEKREAIATQYDSRATCSNRGRKVVFTYTQNT